MKTDKLGNNEYEFILKKSAQVLEDKYKIKNLLKDVQCEIWKQSEILKNPDFKKIFKKYKVNNIDGFSGKYENGKILLIVREMSENETVDRIIKTFLHELTHCIQMSRTDRWDYNFMDEILSNYATHENEDEAFENENMYQEILDEFNAKYKKEN